MGGLGEGVGVGREGVAKRAAMVETGSDAGAEEAGSCE